MTDPGCAASRRRSPRAPGTRRSRPQPVIRATIAAASPRASAWSSEVIADCSAPSMLNARASRRARRPGTRPRQRDQRRTGSSCARGARVGRGRRRRGAGSATGARGTAPPTPPGARGGRRARARARRRASRKSSTHRSGSSASGYTRVTSCWAHAIPIGGLPSASVRAPHTGVTTSRESGRRARSAAADAAGRLTRTGRPSGRPPRRDRPAPQRFAPHIEHHVGAEQRVAQRRRLLDVQPLGLVAVLGVGQVEVARDSQQLAARRRSRPRPGCRA